MPKMIITFNYLITAVAFLLAILLFRRGNKYLNAASFMVFIGVAALLGGFVHHMELRQAVLVNILQSINNYFPSFIAPITYDGLHDRLWLIAILAIGFAEYFFMMLFIEPILVGKNKFFIRYLQAALGIFCIMVIISPAYTFVVAFHIFSHTVIIIFSLYLYFTEKITSVLWLVALAFYNLAIGVVQQLMASRILPSGFLHYNDWYHIGVIIFLAFLYILCTRGHLVDELYALHPINKNGL